MVDGSSRRQIAAVVMIGVGMGGFLDGIVLHQLLQVHNMLSATHPTTGVETEQLAVNLEINMFWDGLFHAFCWIVTAAGIALLTHVVRRENSLLPTSSFIGSLLLGWGAFNLVEGILDHHILHIHHVIEGPGHEIWDYLFLGFSLLLVIAGWMLIRSFRNPDPQSAAALGRAR